MTLANQLSCCYLFLVFCSFNAKERAAMPETCDLQVHINGEHTFFLNEKLISRFSGELRKIVKQEKKRSQIRSFRIDIDDFPGGNEGFEMVSRFCYNNGDIRISVSNVSLLYCSSLFLGMTEKVKTCNLLHQAEIFLEGMFYWSWSDILICLKSCEPFFCYADSCGLVEKLMVSLLAKIAQNSGVNFMATSSSSSSSPSSSSLETPSGLRFSSSSGKVWWFEDMTLLSPIVIDKFVKFIGGYGNENNSLVLTRFLLHYLKNRIQKQQQQQQHCTKRSDCVGIAETAVSGVIHIGETESAFSVRALFWVLRIVSGFCISKESRGSLENLIAGVIDEASLDDLLVSGGKKGGVYDVNLVVRLIRLFVNHDKVDMQKMKRVGRLVDKYMKEIAPDQSLKVSKFVGVAESLPDCARDCFDGVYRAIDIYLESHPNLSGEQTSRICECLNYEKLSLEACKDLAKNPRIPPRIAVQALSSQRPISDENDYYCYNNYSSLSMSSTQIVSYNHNKSSSGGSSSNSSPEVNKEEMRMNLQRMQWRVGELERACKEMKSHMSKMAKGGGGVVVAAAGYNRGLPRLC